MQDTKLSNDLLSNLWLDIQPNQFSCQLYTRLFMPYRLQMIVKGKRTKRGGDCQNESEEETRPV